jgi:hypothetical protein
MSGRGNRQELGQSLDHAENRSGENSRLGHESTQKNAGRLNAARPHIVPPSGGRNPQPAFIFSSIARARSTMSP